MTKMLQVVCAGTGYFSQFHYEAWTRHSHARIVGVYNRSIDKAHEFSNTYNIENVDNTLERLLLKCKPDILDVITPPRTHLDSVRLAAKHGIDVICQKPFGENLEQAKQMTDIAERAGIKLIIHENFRFMPWFRQLKELLQQEVIGDVLNANFKLRPGDGQGENAYMQRQPYFQTMPRFLVHETAIHLVDTFRYLFGEPQALYADLRKCNAHIQGEDAGIVLFDYTDNLRVTFDGNRLLDHSATNTRRTMGEMHIEGTKGVLSLNGEGQIFMRKFSELTFTEVPYEWRDQHFGGDCVFNTIEHIVTHYTKQQALENQGVEYLKNIEIEEAIYQSHAEKRKVTL